eukprot:TRINITY_DN11223_c0_g1_i1.p1 TRINITY_DN11223_c0_g1~~TRINITY_DN11223_c0_g1_i1.p1  ORF type:complete len:213 (+),score=43.24 TRINITY_DN11223_c0_g1_i1:449-1087(+)
MNKLALCVSVIALNTLTSWETAIPDLIAYSLKSPASLFYGCEIIENIAAELEDSRPRLKQMMKARSSVIEALPHIQKFVVQVITAGDVPLSTKQKMMKVVSAWIGFGNARMLEDVKIQAVLIQCCQNPNLCKESIQCITRALDRSRYSKLLENVAYDKAFQEFEQCPFLSFLESLLRYLTETIPKLQDIKAHAGLLFSIGENFSLLFLRVLH